MTQNIHQGPKTSAYRVWWIPQIPMEAFVVELEDLGEAYRLVGTLASYDLFQYHHNIKPDYSNAGGVLRWNDEQGAYEDLEEWEIEEELGLPVS